MAVCTLQTNTQDAVNSWRCFFVMFIYFMFVVMTHMKSKLMVRLKEGKRLDSTLGAWTSHVRIVDSKR